MGRVRKLAYWGFLVSLVVIASLILPIRAQAVESDPDGQIEEGQVIEDDVFLGGERVVIDGEVKGDLFASANTIVINGIIHGSAFLAAQTIEINGTVKGSLYGASQSISLQENARIEHNLYYAGFALQAESGSSIGKDALFTGYQAVLEGKIQRDVSASVGALEIKGEIGRNVRATVGDVEERSGGSFYFYTPPAAPPMIPLGLRVDEKARIGGSLTYRSGKEQSQGIKSKPQGEVIFIPLETRKKQGTIGNSKGSLPYQIGKVVLQRMQELVTLFVIGLIGLWLLPQQLQLWKERMKAEPLASGLNGLLTVLVGYSGAALIALVLLAIGIFLGVLTLGGLSKTVLGIGFSSLGFALAVFSLIVAYLSKVLVALWIGEWVAHRFAPQSVPKVGIVLLVGIFIYGMARSIPILGWVIGVLATLVGVGAIYLGLRDRIRPPAKPREGGEPLVPAGG